MRLRWKKLYHILYIIIVWGVKIKKRNVYLGLLFVSMKKDIFSFTKDYMECIAQAWLFTYQRDDRTIEDTDVLFGVWRYTKKQSFNDFFRKFLGWKKPQLIDAMLKEMYPKIQAVPKNSRLQFHLTAWFQKTFLEFKKQWVNELNFLVLLLTAFEQFNDDLIAYFKSYDIDILAQAKKLRDITKVLYTVSISPVEFFTMLDNIMQHMWLNIEQMEMFMDASQIKQFKDGKGFVMHGWADTVEGSQEQDSETAVKDADDKKLTIEYFATDLVYEAKNDALDPVIWRQKEIDQLVYTLLRKTKNNPLLIWEAGVGKTAIVEWLAQKIAENDVPKKLMNKRLMMLDMWSLVAGTKYRGEFESRLKAITKEAVDPTNNIILFVDEIHTIIWAWNAEWGADAANILKPLLARGKLQLIWATTYDEYQKYIEKDAALKRRFQEVSVEEPTKAVATEIMQWLKERFEEYHGVCIDDEAIISSIEYSTRYMMNKQLPDKAIDIIDEACARASTMQIKLENNKDYLAVENDIADIEQLIEKAIEKQDYFKAAELKEQQESLKKRLGSMRIEQTLPRHLRPHIAAQHIGEVIADKMWLPVEQITESELHRLATLDTALTGKILWQDDAVNAVVQAIKRNRLSAIEHKKPIWSFLLLWPSGVGKTYLAKLLAEEFFGDEKALIRVDMSEFMEKYSVSKLIWSAPWYVGYEEWGLLTEQVRRRPYSVVLFDEIEKASPEVLNIFLQILDEWHLKDNKGRWIDFKNTIILLTSNIGSEHFGKKLAQIGFADMDKASYVAWSFVTIETKVKEQVKDYISPELLNRLTAQIVFKPLEKEVLWQIFATKFKEFSASWKTKPGIKLPRIGKKRIEKIIDEIYDPAYGARPLDRYLYEKIEPDLIEQVISYELDK